MPYKNMEFNSLDDARAIIKSLQEELERTKKQLDILQKRNEELQRLSITDDLTGLFNQRHLFRILEEEVERNKRQKHPLCLIFLDVDDLKSYNDTCGHSAGDDVLRIVAQSISSNIRRNVDSGYRYGGDEFAVILPEVPAKQAVEIARRINRNLQKSNFPNIKLSFGISEIKPEMDSKALLAFADKAMYMAKRGEVAEDIDGFAYKIHVY